MLGLFHFRYRFEYKSKLSIFRKPKNNEPPNTSTNNISFLKKASSVPWAIKLVEYFPVFFCSLSPCSRCFYFNCESIIVYFSKYDLSCFFKRQKMSFLYIHLYYSTDSNGVSGISITVYHIPMMGSFSSAINEEGVIIRIIHTINYISFYSYLVSCYLIIFPPFLSVQRFSKYI